ncbi:MAG TPA: tyrosine-type recombinase/integrase [Acidimicrobiales bacterium]|nr:tyrosine-type recombinase/integrase [Acidimicrobiales bacterium]
MSRQTFERFVVDDWRPAQEWKDTTAESWPGVWARLVPHLGSYQLGRIDQLVLKGVRRELSKRYARNTVKLTMAWAAIILRAAVAAGRIGRDPTAGLRAPKARAGDPTGQVRPEDVPTRAEALAILTSTPAPFRAAVALGMAGLRVGEVLGMSDDRINVADRRLTIDRQRQRIAGRMVFTTPKAEKVRTIVVPEFVVVELRRHVDEYPAGLLFRGRRGADLRRDQFYDSAWKPALLGAGMCAGCRADGRTRPRRDDGCTCQALSFKFHSLRHWCASTLLAEGASLTAVAGHLGDTVETVAKVYVHWLRDDRSISADVLDRVIPVQK